MKSTHLPPLSALGLALGALAGEIVVSPGGVPETPDGAPAFALGFKAWDFEKAGLRR